MYGQRDGLTSGAVRPPCIPQVQQLCLERRQQEAKVAHLQAEIAEASESYRQCEDQCAAAERLLSALRSEKAAMEAEAQDREGRIQELQRKADEVEGLEGEGSDLVDVKC